MKLIISYNKSVEPINYPAGNLLAHLKRYHEVYMLEIPTKEQYKKWTKPSRATLKAYWLGIIAIIITIGQIFYSSFSENSNTKEHISVTLQEFRTSLKQVPYIKKEYRPENVNFSTVDGIMDTVDKLNIYNQKISSVIDFDKLHILVKDFGKEDTNKLLQKLSMRIAMDAKDLSLFVAKVDVNTIKNQQDYDKLYQIYIDKSNKVSESEAIWHGFISGLTLKDFNY